MWGGALYPLRPRTRQDVAVVGRVHINLHPECELLCSNDFRDKQGVLKLMVGALRPHPTPSTG